VDLDTVSGGSMPWRHLCRHQAGLDDEDSHSGATMMEHAGTRWRGIDGPRPESRLAGGATAPPSIWTSPLCKATTVDRVLRVGVGVRDLDPDVEGFECAC
jgi:hypothetical protein